MSLAFGTNLTSTATDLSSVNSATDSTGNTQVTGKSIKVGTTTYYLVESTSKKVATTDKLLSVNEAVEAINKTSNAKAFSSMDALASAIRRDNGEQLKSVSSFYDGAPGKGTLKLKFEAFADLNDAVDFSLHVGADSSDDNKINLNIAQMGARGLGINGLNIAGSTDDNATKAIDVVADALQKVSAQRATLGAVQNRLEHTIANLDNVVENTTSAESAIRDTDMATQMVTYSNNQILAQAGQAMLAQSNQANQGVLSLLG